MKLYSYIVIASCPVYEIREQHFLLPPPLFLSTACLVESGTKADGETHTAAHQVYGRESCLGELLFPSS